MLRALTLCSLVAWAIVPTAPLHAEEGEGKALSDFAPGATGAITAPIPSIMRDAEKNGEKLKESLPPQDAAKGAFGSIDFEQLQSEAFSNARARALLGLPEEGRRISGTSPEERYDGATVFLLASFSMPAPALRQMMEEAKRFGVPVVFRGFVNNSVYDTQAALEKVFGSVDDAQGFSIDPTLFARFKVESVPFVIAANASIDVCETQGCEGDPVPEHDRVGGNVPLEFALRLIGEKGDVAQATALKLLEGK